MAEYGEYEADVRRLISYIDLASSGDGARRHREHVVEAARHLRYQLQGDTILSAMPMPGPIGVLIRLAETLEDCESEDDFIAWHERWRRSIEQALIFFMRYRELLQRPA